jgi:hypothetical protein
MEREGCAERANLLLEGKLRQFREISHLVSADFRGLSEKIEKFRPTWGVRVSLRQPDGQARMSTTFVLCEIDKFDQF